MGVTEVYPQRRQQKIYVLPFRHEHAGVFGELKWGSGLKHANNPPFAISRFQHLFDGTSFATLLGQQIDRIRRKHVDKHVPYTNTKQEGDRRIMINTSKNVGQNRN